MEMKCYIFRAWFAWNLVGENNQLCFWRKNVGPSVEEAQSRFGAGTVLRPLTRLSLQMTSGWFPKRSTSSWTLSSHAARSSDPHPPARWNCCL